MKICVNILVVISLKLLYLYIQLIVSVFTHTCLVNVLKISNTFLFLFSNEMLVSRAGIHKMLVRIANREDLIWVCPVCLGVFNRQVAFEI